MRKLGLILGLILFGVNFVYAAHWISGWSEDALDGTSVNGLDVVMWNPSVGVLDNVTDIIGASGMSGIDNVYLLDCEMLGAGCLVNDVLSLKIFGNRYISWVVNVTISGAGYDVPENLSLNSPPSSLQIFPNSSQDVSSAVDFNCSVTDYDDNIEKVELWGNWSGSWEMKDFVDGGILDDSVIFSDSLSEGEYLWNCFALDNLGIGSFASSNFSFFVDTTSPLVWGVSSVSNVCGFGSIPVDCMVSDNRNVGDVIIQSISPGNSLKNYSASFVSGDNYRASVDLDEVGDWSFECFANDSAGNLNFSSGEFVSVGSGSAEIKVVGEEVLFDKIPKVEGEILNLTANISNYGCIDSGNFVVGFDDGNNFENVSISLSSGESVVVSSLWNTSIGLSNIFVYADLNDDILENNESDNVGNGSVYLRAWQNIYGNISLDIVLAGGEEELGNWSGLQNFAGNIFVSDSEASVEWGSLLAIGSTKSGTHSSGDFSEMDSLLDMGSYNDSISNTFSSSVPTNFSVFGSEIENVPTINSSYNGNFVTGLLWDSADSVNGEYDSSEKEDVVFVSKVNLGKPGNYGVYDYEIVIPSKLRSYDSGDLEKVYLYYDLK